MNFCPRQPHSALRGCCCGNCEAERPLLDPLIQAIRGLLVAVPFRVHRCVTCGGEHDHPDPAYDPLQWACQIRAIL